MQMKNSAGKLNFVNYLINIARDSDKICWIAHELMKIKKNVLISDDYHCQIYKIAF